MRKLNSMFHIDGEQLVKTSNNQAVPTDEPVFILRARDRVAVATLLEYRDQCIVRGTPPDRIVELNSLILQFVEFRNSMPEVMKVPGSTHGH